MAIVEEDIERVRSDVSLVDVVQPYVQLKRVGRNHVGLCPFHAERTGSFNVRDEVGRYHCFGCGAAGDVFRFVQEIEHVDFVAVGRAAGGQGRRHAALHERRRGHATGIGASGCSRPWTRRSSWYHERLLTAPDARAGPRLPAQPRASTATLARQFRLGWAPDDWDALAAGLGAPEPTS